jgi:hypothetical protein
MDKKKFDKELRLQTKAYHTNLTREIRKNIVRLQIPRDISTGQSKI